MTMGMSYNSRCPYATAVLSSTQAKPTSVLAVTSPAGTLFSQNYSAFVASYQIVLSPARKRFRRFYPTPFEKQRRRGAAHSTHLRGHQHVHAVAKLGDKDNEGGGAGPAAQLAETAGIVGGLLANAVVAWSLYTLKTTGCGLPPGPGGVIGGVEGISYVVMIALAGWSVYTKLKTGSGLPGGPLGLLGAVEGLSFLTILATVLVFGLQYVDYGYIPGPVPGEQCFG